MGKICGCCDDVFEDVNFWVQYVQKFGIDIFVSCLGMFIRFCSDLIVYWVLRKVFGRRVKLRMYLCYGVLGFRQLMFV